jgi:phage gpG-like protein
MFTVELDGADQLSSGLASMPAAVRAALAAKAADLAHRLQAHVVQDKLSGQVLQAKTGALKASISATVDADAKGFKARVFSSGDVKYAAIQEYGGQTPAHDILPSKAKALAFVVGGKLAFAKVVHHPGSRIPARSYLRSSLSDMAAEIGDELKRPAHDAVAGAAP